MVVLSDRHPGCLSGGDSQKGVPEDTLLQNWERKLGATADLSQDSHVLVQMKREPPERKQAVTVPCKVHCVR